MEISRDYIKRDAIELYPVETRFFKLPVENMMAQEEIIPNGPQNAIINALNDPKLRFVTACVSRRVGKSFIAYTLGFLKALEPNSKILIVCPNYSLSNIGWTHIKGLIKKYGLETLKENAKDKEIELGNGTLIKLASVSQADSAVGRSYDFIIFDEAAISSKGGDAFNIQLRPTLDKPNSKALFISTPRGNNWFKEFYQRGFSEVAGNTKWCSIHGTYRDNPRASMEDIDEAKLNNSPSFFKQEYEADFSTFEGQIYKTFDYDTHVFNEESKLHELKDNVDGRYTVIAGIDPGVKDPTSACVLYYDMIEDIYFVVADYEQNAKATVIHAKKFKEWEAEYSVQTFYCDAASAQVITDLVYTYDLCVNRANKNPGSVTAGIDLLNTLLHQDKLFIWGGCKTIIDMLGNYQWKDNDLGIEKPLHDIHSHSADALRYAIYTHKHPAGKRK